MEADKFPLAWPQGYPVTERRVESKFKCTFAEARDGIFNELNRLGASSFFISCNVQRNKKGELFGGRLTYDNPGVAVYFTYKGEDKVIACDAWKFIHENMRAVEKSIEAIRGLERWGCSDIISRAMGDMKSLPSASGIILGSVKRPWHEVLEVAAHEPTDNVKRAWRRLSTFYHPDKQFSADGYKFQEVQDAYLEFKKERGLWP